MSKVFILQEPMKKDEVTGRMMPVMDFRRVIEYGEPIVILPTGRVSLTPGPTIDALTEALKNYTDDDYLVSVGDPTAIFVAAMIVGDRNNGKVNLLKWDKVSRQYIKVVIDIHYRTRKGEL